MRTKTERIFLGFPTKFSSYDGGEMGEENYLIFSKSFAQVMIISVDLKVFAL